MEREAEEALVAYLRIDTTNPPGNETAGATYLRDLLAKDGIAAQLVGDDPKRQGVYARLESRHERRRRCCCSATSTSCPPIRAQWTQSAVRRRCAKAATSGAAARWTSSR